MFGKKKEPEAIPVITVGRNDPCHCGSGKKYKKCCADKDEVKRHAALEKQWDAAAKTHQEEEEKKKSTPTAPGAAPKPAGPANLPSHRRNTFVNSQISTPRRSGGG